MRLSVAANVPQCARIRPGIVLLLAIPCVPRAVRVQTSV